MLAKAKSREQEDWLRCVLFEKIPFRRFFLNHISIKNRVPNLIGCVPYW